MQISMGRHTETWWRDCCWTEQDDVCEPPHSLTNVQTTVQSLRPEQVVWTLGKRGGNGASHGDESNSIEEWICTKH